jgi:hypothetical protein
MVEEVRGFPQLAPTRSPQAGNRNQVQLPLPTPFTRT